MLKVLLVDDEAIIKKGLRELIDWERTGFVISGEAADGNQALSLIRNDPPDLVISDIQMPFLTGLDLMENARIENPRMQFLFISGHDEFEYVQRALKLGASDYILKPIDPEYLTGRLEDIARNMKNENRHIAAMQLSRQASIRQFLQNIIFNRLQDEAALTGEAAKLGFDTAGMYFRILSFQIDRYFITADTIENGDIESVHRGFYNIIRNFPQDKTFRITESPRDFDICIVGQSMEELEALEAKCLSGLEQGRESRIFTISIGVSEYTVHLNKLSVCFAQAREALELKFLHGGDSIYTVEQLHRETSASATSETPEQPLNNIVTALKEGNTDAIESSIALVNDRLPGASNPRSLLSWFGSQALLRASRVLEELGYSMEEVIDDPLREWVEMTQLPTAELMLKQLKDLLMSVARYVYIRNNMRSSQILNQAISYIQNHYTESSISLESTASEACMSPCYFSVLFKQETGENFQRYLTKLRIARAKDLILYTDQKSYEIAPQVGYDNASYFSTVFKKSTGMSPSEYRKQFA